MRKACLIVAALCLLCAGLAWAEEPAAEMGAGEAEAIEVAQAPEEPGVACEEMKELGVCSHSPGIAYYYNDQRPEVWVTLGAGDGLRPGALVQFVRNKEVVAEGTVAAVREVDCVVHPDADVVGGAIMLGDSVHVVKNGSRAAVDAAAARERRGHMLLSALVAGGLAYLIVL